MKLTDLDNGVKYRQFGKDAQNHPKVSGPSTSRIPPGDQIITKITLDQYKNMSSTVIKVFGSSDTNNDNNNEHNDNDFRHFPLDLTDLKKRRNCDSPTFPQSKLMRAKL